MFKNFKNRWVMIAVKDRLKRMMKLQYQLEDQIHDLTDSETKRDLTVRAKTLRDNLFESTTIANRRIK